MILSEVVLGYPAEHADGKLAWILLGLITGTKIAMNDRNQKSENAPTEDTTECVIDKHESAKPGNMPIRTIFAPFESNLKTTKTTFAPL